jgi:hypothetical protein
MKICYIIAAECRYIASARTAKKALFPTYLQLWKPINLRTPEDGGNTFSETSVRNSATRYEVPEDIYNWHCRESNPEDSVLRTLIVSTVASRIHRSDRA